MNKSKNIYIIIICIALILTVITEKIINKKDKPEKNIKDVVLQYYDFKGLEEKKEEYTKENENNNPDPETEFVNQINIINADILKKNINNFDYDRLINYIYKFILENYDTDNLTVVIHDNIEIKNNNISFTISVEQENEILSYYYISANKNEFIYEKIKNN